MTNKVYPVTPPFLHVSDYLFLFKNLWSGISRKEVVEHKLSRTLNRRYALLTSSGRLALKLILIALSLPENSEVLIPAYTCIVVPDAVISSGLKPKFVDINTKTANVSLSSFQKATNHNTRAIVLTHMYGNMTQVKKIIKWAKMEKLYIIEDACLALGSKYGSKTAGGFGDASFISFNIGKHITAFGGGLIATDNKSLYRKIESLIKNSEEVLSFRKKVFWWLSVLTGPILFQPCIYRFTLSLPHVFPFLKNIQNPISIYEKDEIRCYPLSTHQINLIASQLERLEWIVKRRISFYKIFREALVNEKSVRLFDIEADCLPSLSHFSFMLVAKNQKDSVMKLAIKKGFRLGEIFNYVCPLVPSYRQNGRYQNSVYVAKRIVNLPFYPDLTNTEARQICQKLKEIFT